MNPMYIIKYDKDIRCDTNDILVARIIDGTLHIRQGMNKRHTLQKLRMDLPAIVTKYGINPETHDPPVFHPVDEEAGAEEGA